MKRATTFLSLLALSAGLLAQSSVKTERCMPKHFVAHGTPTGGLNCAQVSGGERELRNLYLYPFARVIAETDPLMKQHSL